MPHDAEKELLPTIRLKNQIPDSGEQFNFRYREETTGVS
ncbi:Hypothetical protein Cul210932_1631 [Corynebacterium ulcerans]|nr:Hypothetical protein Cul210932_1631 [Corynebacterium ulcerans]ALD95355.1 Hypothetical protein Cul131001_1659 [Corynebacterium ulcerans]